MKTKSSIRSNVTNHSPKSRKSPTLPKPLKRRNGSIAIQTGLAPTLDVRFLCAAIRYPYMFGNSLGDLCIDRQWSIAFTLTCKEIDAFLGDNKRGFHWRQLNIEAGRPYWHWSLGKEYDHQVLVTDLGEHTQVAIAHSAVDPRDALREVIRSLVGIGMGRAEFFNPNVCHLGDLQGARAELGT